MKHQLNPKFFILLTTLLGAGLLLGGLGFFAHAAGGAVQPLIPPIWMEGAPLIQPFGAGGGVQCADDPDGFYLLGGVIGSPWVDTDRVFHYDAATDVWEELASMPLAIRATASACYDGKIYVAGGYSSPNNIWNTFYIYNIAANTWASGPNLPRFVWGAVLGAWDGKVYLVGGTPVGSPYTPVTMVNVYDVNTESWEIAPGPSMLVGASFPGYVQAGPYLYVVGGISGDLFNNVTATQRFDLSTQTWSLGPEFASGRALFGMAVTGQYLYAMGGDQNGDGTPFNLTDLVERLDHTQWSAGVWEEAFSPLPISMGGNAGFCTEAMAGGEIWSVGGNSIITNTNYFHAAEPCFTLYGLTLTPETDAQEGLPGETVTYTLQLTNTGFVTDTYDLAVSAVWTTVTPTPIGPLAPGESTTFQVLVTIPGDAVFFDADTALITATSQGDPDKFATASLTTTVPEYWAEAAQIPEPMGAYGYAQCEDDPDGFYLLGGGTTVGNTDSVYHYDAMVNEWSLPLTPLPDLLRAQATACYEGKIYVAGGYDENGAIQNTFYIYDIATDSWSSGPNLPRYVWTASLGAWGGKVYLVGGTSGYYPWTPVPDVNVYDIATGIWELTPGPPMPVAASLAGAVQAGPYLYVLGGFSITPALNNTALQRFDMANETWSVGPAYPFGIAGSGVAVTESNLYAMGGDLDGAGYDDVTDLVYVLDLASWPLGTWEMDTPLPRPSGASGYFCTEARNGGEVWATGGGILVNSMVVITDTNYYLPAEPCFTVFYGLSLAPETAAQTAYPGETITYTLQVTNTGSVGDSYTVTVNAAWTTTAPVLPGPLDPGATETFEVTVTIPEDASPGEMDLATVTLTSQGDASQTATTTLTTSVSPYAVTITPTEATGASYVGETVQYTLLLTNTGSVTDTFTLDFTGNLWTVTPSFTETTLGPGVAIELSVLVSIPAGATDGETESVTLSVVSVGDPTQTASVTLTTTAVWYKLYLPVIVE